MLCDVGIDAGWDDLHVCTLFRDPAHPERVEREKRWSIPATKEAVQKLSKELPKGCRIAIETSGNTWAVCDILKAEGHSLYVLHAPLVEYIGKSGKKSDRHDPRALAQLLSFTDLKNVWIPDVKTRELRYLASYQQLLTKQITMLKNQIEAVLARNLIRSELADTFSPDGLRWLNKLTLPAIERIQIATSLELIKPLQTKSEEIQQELARATGPEPFVLRLLQMEGIGVRAALHLRARIGNVERFETSRDLVNYFGIAPGSDQSGQKDGDPGIMRLGHPNSRRMLVQCARAAVRTDARMRKYFSHLVYDATKQGNKALIAVGNKMLTILWHVQTTNENYRDLKPNLYRRKLAELAKALGIKDSGFPTALIPESCRPKKRGRVPKMRVDRARAGSKSPARASTQRTAS